MNINNSTEYLMESASENQRLANKIEPSKFINQYLCSTIPKKGKILDIGCGPATVVEKLSQYYPDAHITGIDLSTKRLIQASNTISLSSNLTLLASDLYRLPFKNESFDLIFSRMVFEYLKYPLKALSEIKRVCSSEGCVMIQDIDGQLLLQYPENTTLSKNVGIIFSELHKQTGFDPFVGRKLFHYFSTTGFQNIQVQMEPYHLIPGPINSKDYDYWKRKLSSALPKIPQYTQMTSDDIHEIFHSYLEYLRKKDTLTFSNLFTVYGRK